MIDYSGEPLGKIIGSGKIGICPVCAQHGLITKRDPVDGIIIIDICHWIESYMDGEILGIRELTHLFLEAAQLDEARPRQSQTPPPHQS